VPGAKIPSFKVCAVRVSGTGEGRETATMTAAGEERS